MRRFKTILFTIFSAALVALFGFEVLAAVYLNISIQGNVDYYATEIGAEIIGTYSYDPEGLTGTADYLAFSGGGGTLSNNVYTITGEETSYSNINATISDVTFTSVNDHITFYVFIKNTGDRYIIPNMTVTASDAEHIGSTSSMIFFDVSEGNVDPITVKSNSASATAFVASIETEIAAEHCAAFASNSSLDYEDIWCGKITIMLQNTSGIGDQHIESTFQINIGFMADVQYTANNVLSVYQVQNQNETAWTKFGYNATLNATATKVETNSLSNLEHYLRNSDALGNADISYGTDDYVNAVVYKDIDIVNVDIATGEIIGKLSDLTYDFEWYGRDVTLPAGTTLASGRTLTTSETFTVDVYTYYPTMYVRRWVVGTKQWISVSDRTFSGAVEVPEHYTATFEATPFNPDKTVAHNTYGVVPRSYVYDIGVWTQGSANYLINNYGYTTYSGVTGAVSQQAELGWLSNLTKEWEASDIYNTAYKSASLAQGENYTAFVYNLLYLVKYANNNSQDMVGLGNVSSQSLYNASGVTVTTSNGNTVTTGGTPSYAYYESIKGGGTIGVCNTGQKGTATYDATTHKLSETGFNAAGMNYGYNNTYTHFSANYSATYVGEKQGLYTHQFLTYNTGTKRYLLDGYVGSSQYTSVFCLGLANTWGNVYTWLFGAAILADGSNVYAYINFDNYDYAHTSTSWQTNSPGTQYATTSANLISRGYVKLSYALSATGSKRYMGVSQITTNTGYEMLIGLQPAASDNGTSNTGLCDYFFAPGVGATTAIYGIERGGHSSSSSSAGVFFFANNVNITNSNMNVGFRAMLV